MGERGLARTGLRWMSEAGVTGYATWDHGLATEALAKQMRVRRINETEHDVVAVVAPEPPVARTERELRAKCVDQGMIASAAVICCHSDLMRPARVDHSSRQLAFAPDHEPC